MGMPRRGVCVLPALFGLAILLASRTQAAADPPDLVGGCGKPPSTCASSHGDLCCDRCGSPQITLGPVGGQVLVGDVVTIGVSVAGFNVADAQVNNTGRVEITNGDQPTPLRIDSHGALVTTVQTKFTTPGQFFVRAVYTVQSTNANNPPGGCTYACCAYAKTSITVAPKP
jgi:hypothetical protein